MEENNHIDEMTPKQKIGFKVLISIVRKKFPYIKDLLIPYPIHMYDSMMSIDIVFDVNDMYRMYKVGPPEHYKEFPFLYNSLNGEGSYLLRYVDDQYDHMFGNTYNKKLEEYITLAYSSLPPDMRVNQYEATNDPEDSLQYRWKIARDTTRINLHRFLPIFDENKL
jgi:hypothetical protein